MHDYPAAGIKLSPQLVATLHTELPHVGVIKLEETPSAPKVSAIRALGLDIGIIVGLGGMFFLEELERSSDGMMIGFSHPEVLVDIYRAYRAGDKGRARGIFYGACPILRYEFQPGIGLALRKEVYRQRGAIRSAFVRHPGTQVDAQLWAELAGALHACGLGLGEVTA